MNSQPNLLFILADQMRGTAMGCAGNNQIITPNMNKMAEEGFMFKNAVSVFPVCTPARASLISGRYPTSVNVMDNDVPLPIDGKGFGHILKKNEYRTGWIGKWHLFGPKSVRETYIPPGKHRHGFEDLWAVLNCKHNYLNSYYYLNDSSKKRFIEGYEPNHQTDLALDFITRYKDEPFALFLSWGPPHDPFEQVPQKWKSMYDINDLHFRKNVNTDRELIKDSLPGNFKKNCASEMFFNNFGTGEYKGRPKKKTLRDYYAAITALDYNLGRLIDHLNKLGIDNNTILVFTSDHGEMMYSQRAVQKNYPWKESLNVPFLIKYPEKINPGRSSETPFNTVDIMPTLLDLMNISIPSFSEGTSFKSLLMGKEQIKPEAAYIMCAFPWIIPEWRGVRTKRYTYVKSLKEPLLLYDNKNDPYQMNNLVNESKASDLIKYYDNLTDKMAKEIGDPFDPWEVIDNRMEKIRKEWLERYDFNK